MANNVAATPGTGVTFKTTDTAGVHTGHVNVDSSALPTGAATAANQATAIGHLDGVETLLTAIDGRVDGLETLIGTTNTTLTTIDGRVDGLETLITSTNTKLDTAITALQIIDNMVLAAGTNNIGDVDVLTLPADPMGANADAASATTSISAKLRAIATALGVTALDLGVGTGGTRTLRVAVDSSQTNTGDYEWVNVSQSDQVMGPTGATGDYLDHVLIVPGNLNPGVVQIQDGAGTARTIFTGGTASVSNLVPFSVPIGAISTAGAWSITTGADVTAIGFGNFT